MDFAGKLAKLLADGDDGAGIGQNELHRRSGVPQSTINGYLKRVNRPSWAHVQAIAKALAVDCNALADDEDAKPPLPADEPPPRVISKRK